ncbi:hypothetical protein M434DRAFT_367098 [Hypoxylon sp. CO27-5]|nr:hypothetical protein M434DRAFT_367098 [Hypoxylon sp. CO27-5]
MLLLDHIRISFFLKKYHQQPSLICHNGLSFRFYICSLALIYFDLLSLVYMRKKVMASSHSDCRAPHPQGQRGYPPSNDGGT